jgi:hypothetical protein
VKKHPVNIELLPAYFNAGMAVAAFEYGVKVHQLSLRVRDGKRDRPKLASLDDFLRERNQPTIDVRGYFDYATVLVSGTVGRLIGLEDHLDLPELNIERLRLERAFLHEACLCNEQETDRALTIIVGYLFGLERSDPLKVMRRLWRRANLLLRQDAQRARLNYLANEILRRRKMTLQEIEAEFEN